MATLSKTQQIDVVSEEGVHSVATEKISQFLMNEEALRLRVKLKLFKLIFY